MVLSWDAQLLHLLLGEEGVLVGRLSLPPPRYGGMGALEALTHSRTISSTRPGTVALST